MYMQLYNPILGIKTFKKRKETVMPSMQPLYNTPQNLDNKLKDNF
jgi:hypothetical protein